MALRRLKYGGGQTIVDVSIGLVSLIGADLGPRLKKDQHVLKYGVSVMCKEDDIAFLL